MLIPQANMIDISKIMNIQAELASKMSKNSILNDTITNIITIPGKGATMKYVKLIEGFNFTPRRMASSVFASMMAGAIAKMSKDIPELKVGQTKMSENITGLKVGLAKLEVGQDRMSEDIAKIEALILQLISNQK